MRRIRIVILTVALLAVTLSGCAFTTARLALDYQPNADRKSPLSTVPARVIALRVEDQRPGNERDRVGDKKNNFGMVTAPVVSTKDVSSVILDALKSELQNNGHTVRPEADKADVVITTALKRYWANMSIRTLDVAMTGIIVADVTVSPARNRSAEVRRPLNTTLEEGAFMGGDGAFESVLNKTLAEFVRNFSRDAAVLDALKGAK